MEAQLYALLQSLPAAKAAYDADDDATAVAALNAAVRTEFDTTLRTSGWLMTNFPKPQAALVLRTMRQVAAMDGQEGLTDDQKDMVEFVIAAYDKLNSMGIDLASDETRAHIDALAAIGGWPDELRDGLKAYGRWEVNLAEEQLGRAVTTDDLAAIRAWQGGLTYDRYMGNVGIVLQPGATPRINFSARVRRATSDGRLGAELPAVVIADAASVAGRAALPEKLRQALDLLQSWYEDQLAAE